jgi:hypothetical protein
MEGFSGALLSAYFEAVSGNGWGTGMPLKDWVSFSSTRWEDRKPGQGSGSVR